MLGTIKIVGKTNKVRHAPNQKIFDFLIKHRICIYYTDINCT